MTFPKKLTLVAWAPSLLGCGAELELPWTAYRPNNKATLASWRGVIELKVDRYMVLQLADQIRLMQIRDRERLAQETDRLEAEVAPLQIKAPT